MRHYSRAELEQVYNSIVGERMPGRGEQGILAQSLVQNYRLGARRTLPDGRVFRYALAAGAIQRANLVESAALGGALTTEQDDLVIAAAVVGARQVLVTVDTTDQPANLFADGYLTGDDGTNAQGVGAIYEILSHPILVNAVLTAITLKEPLAEALAAALTVSLHTNLYLDVVSAAAAAAAVGIPTGFPLIDIADNNYFWLQTWGLCPVLTDAGAVLEAVFNRGTAGHVVLCAAGTISPNIGWYAQTGAAEDCPMGFLTIAQ